MEAFIEFIQNWGYLAVFIGSLVEGESVILTASALAKLGYLNIYKIMIIAFLGTLFADQALYFVGRYYGPSIFERFPKYKPASQKAFKLLHRLDAWFILSFRFIWGIRTISPIVIGASGLSPKRFIPLNFIAALIWTIISCTGGYMLGYTIDNLAESLHTIKQAAVYLFLAFVIVVGVVAYFLKKKGWFKDDGK
ncbi:MAG TPA: DedA family protein [Alphaproteobacteria bacterium]|nr:DedA family protein [Alphaproteobacteria bacterium]